MIMSRWFSRRPLSRVPDRRDPERRGPARAARTGFAALAAVLAMAAATSQGRAAAADPDWPCIQVRNPEISATAIWGGPELKGEALDWTSDYKIANVVRSIASRRTPIEQAEKTIDAFAAGEGPKDLRLTRLFVGMLEVVNQERQRVMSGIVRYSRKQHALADRIEKVGDQINALKAGKPVEGVTQADLQKLEDELVWDRRVFDERNQALQYVCESPVNLEQRAFDLARMIQEKM
jgi:hypothetical protein